MCEEVWSGTQIFFSEENKSEKNFNSSFVWASRKSKVNGSLESRERVLVLFFYFILCSSKKKEERNSKVLCAGENFKVTVSPQELLRVEIFRKKNLSELKKSGKKCNKKKWLKLIVWCWRARKLTRERVSFTVGTQHDELKWCRKAAGEKLLELGDVKEFSSRRFQPFFKPTQEKFIIHFFPPHTSSHTRCCLFYLFAPACAQSRRKKILCGTLQLSRPSST